MVGIFLLGFALTTGGCKKKSSADEEYLAPYHPTFSAKGVKYNNSGYAFLYFEIKCTSDAVEITNISAYGPFGSATYSGGGETFNQNQTIYLYDEDKFLYHEGKYTFTINGYIRSGSHSGDSFSLTAYYELIIP